VGGTREAQEEGGAVRALLQAVVVEAAVAEEAGDDEQHPRPVQHGLARQALRRADDLGLRAAAAAAIA
jgi:hypothetical protein